MATINPATASDGETIDASDLNNPINTIADEINGNLDNSNIASDAAIEITKLASPAWTSHSATITGWGTPSQNCSYMQVGSTVFFKYDVGGTSNSTAVTISLPVTAASGNYETSTGFSRDNGVTDIAPGRAYNSDTTTLTVARLAGSASWTASGTKTVRGVHIYEAA